MLTEKNKNNPFIDFLIEEFSSYSKPKTMTRKKAIKKGDKVIAGKHPDHLLLDMLIKEKHRKVLTKMGKIEKALDYHLRKTDKKKSKEIHDIEDKLVAEWQNEFIALREDILKSIPKEQRKNYRQMLSDYIKESINHPHHLYPFTLPVNDKNNIEIKSAHNALKVVTAALVALIFAISLVSASSGFTDKLISATDKFLAYPIVKADQIFYSGKLTGGKIATDKKNNLAIDKKILSQYIVKNRDKLQNQNDEINLTEKDIYGVVAGVEESASKSVATTKPKETKKCVLIHLKNAAEKIGETQKRISLNLEKKLNNLLMNF